MPPHRSAPAFIHALTLGAALLFGGCASVYRVTVDASARPAAEVARPVSYRIENRNVVPGRALRNAEIASHVRTALSAQGLYEAPDADSADMVVEISYGIGPPRTQSAVYQELVFGRPVPAGECQLPPPESRVAREMIGYTPMANTSVTREKHMSIRARENRPTDEAQPPADFWQVHVTIDDEGDDLRGHLPVLASAAMSHIGRATNGPAEMTLRSDDDAVRFIRRGM